MPVHDDRRLIPDYFRIVTAWKNRHVPRPEFEFRSVFQRDVKASRDVVLKMEGFAPRRPGCAPNVLCPPPARFQRYPSDYAIADPEELYFGMTSNFVAGSGKSLCVKRRRMCN